MYMAFVIAASVIALFAFPAIALLGMKLVKSWFQDGSGRPEPPRPNQSSRNIPGGNSGKSD
jgi:hypothetical protein